MDLRNGFRIDEPSAWVPWTIPEDALADRLGPSLRQVANQYWVARGVRVLDGLECHLGFHFHGEPGELSELEFFRDSYPDLAGSFQDFQEYFENAFGPPTETHFQSEQSPYLRSGFPAHRWLLPGVEIVHMVVERFTAEEHMRIRRR